MLRSLRFSATTKSVTIVEGQFAVVVSKLGETVAGSRSRSVIAVEIG
jgi:hypothetical protein